MASSVERRYGQRFPIAMDVKYRLTQHGRTFSCGQVQTVDISSTGVLLNTLEACPEGTAAELSIDWPAHPENMFTVQLRLVGSVVRTDSRGTAIRIIRHRFKRSQDEFSAKAVAWPGFPEETVPEPAAN
jgi:hypothetical protein